MKLTNGHVLLLAIVALAAVFIAPNHTDRYNDHIMSITTGDKNDG